MGLWVTYTENILSVFRIFVCLVFCLKPFDLKTDKTISFKRNFAHCLSLTGFHSPIIKIRFYQKNLYVQNNNKLIITITIHNILSKFSVR
jgi:hypothetical protein